MLIDPPPQQWKWYRSNQNHLHSREYQSPESAHHNLLVVGYNMA